MPRSARLQPVSIALPEPTAARRRFDSAAATFDSACAAHDYAREVLLERLGWVDLSPRVVVDAGCATARASPTLRARYPQAVIVGLDNCVAMLAAAARRHRPAVLVQGSAEAQPFADRSVDLLLANLVLPWCDPQALLRECARVLAPRGLLLLSSTGPATLQELRRAWRSVDADVHVHASFDMQTLGDMIVGAGLTEPVLDTDTVTLRYSEPARLHAELHASGAANAARGRRRSLTGTGRFARYCSALLAEAGADTGIDVSLELVFAQAWGRSEHAERAPPQPQFHGIALRRE